MKRTLLSLTLLVLTVACLLTSSPPPTPSPQRIPTAPASPTQASIPTPAPTIAPSATPNTTVILQRGVNFANMLEAPREGDWGFVVQEEYFDLVKEAGFDFVRLPIRWNAHADESAPYTIDSAFYKRIDQVVEWTLARDLAIILDFHHYEEMALAPTEHKERFLAIWGQIAEHYQNYPPQVLFELLNEPNGDLDERLWNQYLSEALTVVRRTNPTRDVIVGPVWWNSYAWISALELPNDPHLIVTFHYYEPFQFTHQGADWVGEDTTSWLGTTWDGTDAEKTEIASAFDSVQAWAKQNKVRVLLGEFGSYSPAPMDSRLRWTAFVREQAEAHGFAWAYWNLVTGFGIYDPEARSWRADLLRALIS